MFKDEKNRIAVLLSQWMAAKVLTGTIDAYLSNYPVEVRQELGELLSRQPFKVRREVARSMKADVHEVVYKNLNDREQKKKSWKR